MNPDNLQDLDKVVTLSEACDIVGRAKPSILKQLTSGMIEARHATGKNNKQGTWLIDRESLVARYDEINSRKDKK